MQGVTAAIVGFIFVCIAYPKLIRHRMQFNGAIGLVLGVILLDCIGRLSGDPSGALARFAYVFCAFLQIGAILLLVMSAGGKTLGELTEEMSETIDAVRHGAAADNSVVVTKSEQPKPRSPVATPPRPPIVRKPPDSSSIPLD